jgi:hypothetical protein
MLEQQLRGKGLRRAPEQLAIPIVRYARRKSTSSTSWLEVPWVWRVAGFVPLLDWVLLAVALVRGRRIRFVPAMPVFNRGGQI